MSIPTNFRPAGAALLIVAVLAGAYEGAQRLPPVPLASSLLPGRTHGGLRPDSAAGGVAAAAAGVASEVVTEPELAPPCPARPIRFGPLSAGERRPLGLHRYVGTVGGQPATALLGWKTLAEVSGRFYLHRGGPTYALDYEAGSPALLRVQCFDNSTRLGRSQGAWHLAGRLGAVLRGTWHDTTGNHPFYLRESYAGGVRADVHTLRLAGGQSHAVAYESGCAAGHYWCDYLQFPAPAGEVAPALRRTLGPPPAVVRRRLRALYDDAHQQQRTLTSFLLNDFRLLSFQVERFEAFITDGGKGPYWTESYLFDLATGRELTLASQLRPGYERPLRRLIQQHLLHDAQFDFVNREHRATWDWQDSTGQATGLVALPAVANYDDSGHATGLSLLGSGLEVSYFYGGPFTVTGEAPRELSNQDYSLAIPYAELRPLVRPGTPLARMLRARGLW